MIVMTLTKKMVANCSMDLMAAVVEEALLNQIKEAFKEAKLDLQGCSNNEYSKVKTCSR